MPAALRVCAMALCMLASAGCGQKGPLFLPDREVIATPPPAPDAATAPEREESKEDEEKGR